jgi:hypothetical protein
MDDGLNDEAFMARNFTPKQQKRKLESTQNGKRKRILARKKPKSKPTVHRTRTLPALEL